MEFGQLEQMTAALGGLVAIASLAITYVNAAVGRMRDRRARAIALYQDFYSADNYRRVVLPVYRLDLKRRALTGEAREAYIKAVRMGWLGADTDPKALMEAYISPENLSDSAEQAHFRNTLSSEQFTEHEALTVFLYFWMKVGAMMRNNLIEERMARRLLETPYNYYRELIDALRDDLCANGATPQSPAWIQETIYLEKHVFN